MDGQTNGQKDNDLREQRRLHERGGTELCLNVWRQQGRGSPHGGPPGNDLVSTGPGRKLPGWTVGNYGDGTPRGPKMRPGEVGQVRASSELTLPHHMATRGDSALSSTIRTEDSVVTGQPQSGGDTLGDKV